MPIQCADPKIKARPPEVEAALVFSEKFSESLPKSDSYNPKESQRIQRIKKIQTYIKSCYINIEFRGSRRNAREIIRITKMIVNNLGAFLDCNLV